MALIPCCDRCNTFGRQLKEGFDSELCATCEADFRVWVKTSVRSKPLGRTKTRSTRKRLLQVACELIARDGYVTDESYGRVMGLSARDAYYRLAHLRRTGLLSSDRAPDGGVRFALARAEAAE